MKFQITDETIMKTFIGYEGSVMDFAWAVFQKILTEVANAFQKGDITEEQFYRENKDIYFEMTFFQRRHENKKGNHVFQLALYNDLLYNKYRTRLKLNVVIISGHCCTFCNNLNNQQIPFEEALKEQYLGSNNCTRECGCNCTYAFRTLRDSNGKLIKND